MKHLLFLAILICSSSAFASEFPERKAGLWEIKTMMSVSGQSMNQTMKQCVDKETDRELLSKMDNAQGECTGPDFKKNGSEYTFSISCTSNGTTMEMNTVYSGDFNSEYTGTTTVSFNPPLPHAGTQKVQITARWIGPCGEDLKPGEVSLSDGMKLTPTP